VRYFMQKGRITLLGYSGIRGMGGGDQPGSGWGQRVTGGHPFLVEWMGSVHHFSAKDKNIVRLRRFWIGSQMSNIV
jgi:hypothetical protein